MPDSDKENQYASIEEVLESVDSLSDNDYKRLYNYANHRISMFSSFAGVTKSYKPEELLREAIKLSLEKDRRRWRKSAVDLVGHLLGTMRSITSHWQKSVDAGDYILECVSDNPGKEEYVITPEDFSSEEPSMEESTQAEQLVTRIYNEFKDDKLVKEIIEGRMAGLKWREIQDILGKNECEAARKRLSRKKDLIIKN